MAGEFRVLMSIDATLRRIAESVAAMELVDEHRSYTKRQAARILGSSVRTVERRINDGSLMKVGGGRIVRVSGQSLRQLLVAARAEGRVGVVRI